MNPKKHLIFRLDAHYKMFIALGISVIAFLLFRDLSSLPAVILTVWIAFASSLIVLDWIVILWAHPREIRKIARLEDSSRSILFLIVISASVMSLGAILYLLISSKGGSKTEISSHVVLAMSAVVISWWLVHTIYTLRYGHLYYSTNPDDDKKKPMGGLLFPEENEPDYLDFVYFSFVLGMTFQVSDVQISSRMIRRIAWGHGLIAFAFNTAIVALSINVISGLISQ
ncbi:DUF1345 domain-containing protein [Mucilaginibacter sp. L3T2-6]|uniref:DUF1345 domain-containing protein n=1 Tax=Mucilaginibacter sp. L3T2-6 TaxID=3062491 RepID=UPI002675D00E|nr:DUF1345 domain-containing protein [Mucilaginibacter sp. L3T2-6]MDO3644781.1 DUF1345 domain-containing protein [Mucilaginibacter sp. L3T2-6]MDV6217183.1 DUF1345 domain-containing protein [Mucilaginibacter sp. L3T2-6]